MGYVANLVLYTLSIVVVGAIISALVLCLPRLGRTELAVVTFFVVAFLGIKAWTWFGNGDHRS